MKEIVDFDFEGDVPALLNQYADAGFQASRMMDAVSVVERMKEEHCTVFLSFTANMVASGLRGAFKELCRKKFVDAIITTAGSIDHDVIKSLAPYYQGDFNADDVDLHKHGMNRIGNVLVPSAHFELFEKEMKQVLNTIGEQDVSPRELISYIAERMYNESRKDSFLHHCAAQKIPVYCPGITDGALGVQLHFYKQDHPGFRVDVTKDMKELADITLNAEKTGAIVLGGGISKHHVIGVNLLREGLDYAVYVSTASEYDGSLSGAQTREAKSWGKIRENARSVSVFGEASIVFPLMMAHWKARGVL